MDNEAKACLDDVALDLQRSSDAKLALVGNENAKEQAADAKLAKLKRNKKPADAAARVSQHQGLPGYGEGDRCLPHHGLRTGRTQEQTK